MIRADHAISRVRRDLTLGLVLKVALLLAVIASVVVPGLTGIPGGDLITLLVVGGVWLVLSYRSMRGSRMAAMLPQLIATGQYNAAEQQAEQALRSFSIFRTVKLLSMHHLAVLRHAQRRWSDAAALSRALLNQRLGTLRGLGSQTRLILADALLEMNDLRGAYDAMGTLYQQRLSLGEAMNLLGVQLDYQSRVAAWPQMMEQVQTKVQLAELMPSPASAKAQALLALAAMRTGRHDWADWLRRRVELLTDVQQLCTRRPVLWEVWRTNDEGPRMKDECGVMT